MQGKICQWRDDKGFGFIEPEDGSEQLFFHVSGITASSARPQVGESVLYETSLDAQQRLRAIKVTVGEHLSAPTIVTQFYTPTKPWKKGGLDYALMLTIIASVAVLAYQYYLTADLTDTWYFAILGLVAALLLKRPKRPKEKQFNCRGCRAMAEYDQRTLLAWQAGFTQLYCKQCHGQWLRNRPKSATQPEYNSSISKTSADSGCLGVLVLLAFIPIVTTMGLYHWLV